MRRPFSGHAPGSPAWTSGGWCGVDRRSRSGERGLDSALARLAASGVSSWRWHGRADERGPNPASARPSTTSGIPDPAWRGRSTRRARSRPAADTAEPHDEPAPRSGDNTIKAHGEPGRAPALTPTTSHGEPGLDPAMTPPSHTASAARSGAGTIQGPAAPPSRSARRPFRIPVPHLGPAPRSGLARSGTRSRPPGSDVQATPGTRTAPPRQSRTPHLSLAVQDRWPERHAATVPKRVRCPTGERVDVPTVRFSDDGLGLPQS